MASKSTTRVLSEKMQAKDITENFRQAARALHTGQLVKDEYFTLFESVSALEIGDPKMDSGLLEPGESLLEEYDVCKELLPEEVLGIMDQMLCHEVAWYMGHSLSQTLYTSVYIDRLLWPEPKALDEAQFWRNSAVQRGGPLVHRILRSYCVGTIKCCDFVHEQVCGQHYYEDEDFSSQVYNRPLLHRVDADEILLLLDDAQTYLEESSLSMELRSALDNRLIFRQELLSALQRNSSVRDFQYTSSNSSAFGLLEELSKSCSISKPVEGSFSLKLQRTMASSAPPRPMVNIPFAEACDFLRRMCQDTVDLLQVANVEGNERIWQAIHLFMSRTPQPSAYVRSLLQTHLSRNDRIFDRQTLKEFIFADLQSLVLPGSMLLDPENEKAEAPSSDRFKIAASMDDFVREVGQSYWSIFRSTCLNRARVRRTLCHFVAEWDNLQVEIEELDTSLQPLVHEEALLYSGASQPSFSYPLSSWMYHWKLHQLRCFLQMGFELSVYLPNELPGMLWYTSHICTTHLAHLNRMSFFVEEAGRRHRDEAAARKQSSKTAIDTSNQVDVVLWKLDRQFHHVRAHDNLAEALHALYVVLQRHHLLSAPSQRYSSDRLRYELRMKSFLSLGIPQILPFEDFNHENRLDGESDTAMIDRAIRAAGEARRSWEEVLSDGWAPERNANQTTASKARLASSSRGGFDVSVAWNSDVKNTIRACIATNIAVSAVKKRMEKANAAPGVGALHGIKVEIPTPGEKGSYSAHWPVPKIVEL